MSRKLQTSLNALVITAALCATGAFAAAAVPFAAPATRSIATVASAVDGGHHKSHPNRLRHVLAMPYFSFVPRD
ncbi:hypothetical protein [Cognatilysobacter lacus]|uniref:Uncharacterized protein n=1 Tax=Cognatilysobacter lacus TaxID=1643323 RepID=A0A5D8Z6Q1_9GAMM|nr:hypothetical protein [Lysobacter lacus]TZF90598.1 hypothetical protein FW784_04610 [Lysobacter lacus]